MSSRRADAPQTTNADTPRVAALRRAAIECVKADHSKGHPITCPLRLNLPDSGPTSRLSTETVAAVTSITGQPVDLRGPGNIAARLRSQLRRWAIKNQRTQ